MKLEKYIFMFFMIFQFINFHSYAEVGNETENEEIIKETLINIPETLNEKSNLITIKKNNLLNDYKAELIASISVVFGVLFWACFENYNANKKNRILQKEIDEMKEKIVELQKRNNEDDNIPQRILNIARKFGLVGVLPHEEHEEAVGVGNVHFSSER